MTDNTEKLRFDRIEIDNSEINPRDTAAAQQWLNSRVAAAPGADFVSISPALAFELLRNNADNRSISRSNVDDIKRAILAGSFRANGEAIVLANTGELNDGQHRLIAVVMANQPIQTLIAWGVDRDSRMTVDTGRKRTNAGFLAMQGVKYSNLSSGIASALYQYERHNTVDNPANAPSTSEMLETYELYKDEIGFATGKISSKEATAIGGQSLLTLAFLLFRRKNPTAAAEFIELYLTGAGLNSDSPILTSRNRLMRDFGNGKRLKRGEKMELIVRAWNAWRDGRTTKNLPVMGNLPHIQK